ncbi:MAG: rhomboid family intramembrane serine protease [Parachlamydia sp.]|nr:rhomboid family intramembrane serine protease [Parachlamydia sp.]
MRLIYTSDDQRLALKFSEFLKREGIDNQCEIQTNRDWGSPNYGDVKCYVWVVEEDQMDLAHRWVEEFNANPNGDLFEAKSSKSLEPPPVPSIEKPPLSTPFGKMPPRIENQKSPLNQGMGLATFYLVLICSVLFFFGLLTTPSEEVVITKLPAAPLYIPPFYKSLLYDYPQAFEILDKLVNIFGMEKLQKPDELPAEGKILLKKFSATPYWQGIYNQLVSHVAHPNAPWNFATPMFEKIRQGEIWRLVTPILIHANIFHLVFNMLWLIVLGKLIEDRIGIPRYLILILAIAIISNTAQYLMSGSNALGISGVIVGLLGFIWSRQRCAAWEGYRLTPGVFTFMLAFILGVAFIQLIAFFQEAFWHNSSFPAIANTSHLIGGIVGLLLGRLEFFRMKSISP